MSNEKFSLLNLVPNPSLIFGFNEQGLSISFANQAYLDFTGLCLANIQGISFDDFSLLLNHNTQYATQLRHSIESILQNHHSEKYVSYWKSISEYNYTTIEVENKYFTDNSGIYVAHLIVVENNSTIATQPESNDSLRYLFESVIVHTTEAVIITEANPVEGLEPKIVFVNKSFTNMTGYRPSEAIGKSPAILHGKNTDPKALQAIKEALIQEKPCEVDIINYKKNQDEYWVHISISPVYNHAGKLIYWIALERDITVQKEAELQKQLLTSISHEFHTTQTLSITLRNILESIVTAKGLLSAEFWLVETNKNTLKHFVEYPANESPATVLDIPMGQGPIGQIWASKKVQKWTSNNFPTSNNTEQATAIGYPIIDLNEVVGVMVLEYHSTQYTKARKKNWIEEICNYLGAEIKRKQHDDAFNQIFNHAPDIICLLGMDGYFKQVNPMTCQTLEYTQEELLSQPFINFLFHEDRERTYQSFKSLHSFTKVYHFENRFVTKSGKIKWIAWTSSASIDEQYLLAIGRNITEKKNLENLLDKTYRMARIGSWEVNFEHNTIYWSDFTKQILEAPIDIVPSLENSFTFYKEGYHRDTIVALVQYAITKGKPWDAEFIVVTTTGRECWVRTIGEVEFKDGKCIRLYGSIQDIDKRKKAELELREVIKEKNMILENTGDGFLTLDKNWVITYWNQQIEKLTGVSKQHTMGKVIWDVFAESVNTEIYEKCLYAANSHTIVNFETYYVPFNKWIEIRVYPTEQGVSIYASDITERYNTQKRIQEERNLLRTLIDNLPETVYFKDINARKMISNQVDVALIGTSSEQEVLGKTDLELFDGELGKIGYEHDMTILATGQPLINYEQIYIRDGQPIWLQSTKIPLKNEKNEVIGILGIGRDVTERKQDEEKLLALNKELEEYVKQLEFSNIELEQFAYVASHDLQEPLRMITSFLSQIEKKYESVLDEKGKQYIYYAVDGAKRMRQIILDLLDFSRIGRIQDDTQAVNLNTLINEIMDIYSEVITETKAEITYKNLPTITTSKIRVQQIFQNLIGNALKYRKPNEVPIIRIEASQSSTHWKFAVNDNGIGIDSEYFDTIFAIFQRLHTREEYSGTGIGLAIVKKIVELLGGKIWIESQENLGSTFYFTLKKLP
ncbi:PAS domain S-box protein [Flectobacillus major]|uniref:PAS domain S-box protein n=1 Tax=Flectobacillus major TaxID=103 RepID=UPI00047D533F|nr:PAS domain S-box protein [Flectobacillus major]